MLFLFRTSSYFFKYKYYIFEYKNNYIISATQTFAIVFIHI
ncbi:hypothetical protein M067_1562 [Bacteroides fragilis str. J-143-4]|nr:hypothetical protein M067_1562 [Bacteroides fragilis str. J-143-4]